MAEPGSQPRVRARNLLSSYYGVADETPTSAQTADDDDVRGARISFAPKKHHTPARLPAHRVNQHSQKNTFVSPSGR